MKQEVATRFLNALGAKHIVAQSGWVNCSCPLAPFTHKNSHDHQPSFGISLESGLFNCFSCGASGGLGRLVSTLLVFLQAFPELMERYDFKTAYAILDGVELEGEPLPEFTEFEEHKVFKEWPEWWLDQYPPSSCVAEAAEYLERRGVPPSLQESMELRWDAWRNMVVCPYRTAFGKLAGARGRCIDAQALKSERHHEYKVGGQNNAQLVWYNEQALQNDGPIIVVEGQFDVLHLLQVTPNVVGNLTAKIPEPKLAKLTAKDAVILMLDNDDTGQMAMHGNLVYPGAIKLLMDKGVSVAVMEYPTEYKDPDKVPLEWLKSNFEGIVPCIG